MPLAAITGTGVALAAATFAAGLAIGLAASAGARRLRSRVRELENDLRRSLEEQAAYRDQVSKHFEGTSELFRDLTRQYTELYAHLAEGARDLCRERVPAIGRGFGDPLLAPPATPEPAREASLEPGPKSGSTA